MKVTKLTHYPAVPVDDCQSKAHFQHEDLRRALVDTETVVVNGYRVKRTDAEAALKEPEALYRIDNLTLTELRLIRDILRLSLNLEANRLAGSMEVLK